MSVARALWSQTVAPGKTMLERVDCDIKLSLVVLDETLANQERSSVKIIQHDSQEDDKTTFVLANLIPGKVEAQTVDLIISLDEDIEIEVTGKNTVHLCGNYIFQREDDVDSVEYSSDDEGASVDEGAFRLQDVSSDVEMGPDELMEEDEDEAEARFEEVVEEIVKEKAEASPKVAVKRPAEASPTQGSTQKKHKKNKGGDNKPAAAAATGGVKPEAKAAAPTANVANSKPAGSQSGEGKKHKKNKNKDKQKNA